MTAPRKFVGRASPVHRPLDCGMARLPREVTRTRNPGTERQENGLGNVVLIPQNPMICSDAISEAICTHVRRTSPLIAHTQVRLGHGLTTRDNRAGSAHLTERNSVLTAAAGCSHSRSFDQRRRPETLRTAMAMAFFCPTNTTSRLPRVTPV